MTPEQSKDNSERMRKLHDWWKSRSLGLNIIKVRQEAVRILFFAVTVLFFGVVTLLHLLPEFGRHWAWHELQHETEHPYVPISHEDIEKLERKSFGTTLKEELDAQARRDAERVRAELQCLSTSPSADSEKVLKVTPHPDIPNAPSLRKPRSANEFYERGVRFEEYGFFKEAVDDYRCALLSNPEFPEAHDRLGVCLARMGQFDDAFTHLNKSS